MLFLPFGANRAQNFYAPRNKSSHFCRREKSNCTFSHVKNMKRSCKFQCLQIFPQTFSEPQTALFVQHIVLHYSHCSRYIARLMHQEAIVAKCCSSTPQRQKHNKWHSFHLGCHRKLLAIYTVFHQKCNKRCK